MSSASVTIEGTVVASIDAGLLVLLGVHADDADADVSWLAGKIAALRIFPDAEGKMNLSLTEFHRRAPTADSRAVGALVVSQFTLFASTRKGARPSFNDAAKPELAVPLYERFIAALQTLLGFEVATGRFGADMKVALVNDGPVTLILDSHRKD